MILGFLTSTVFVPGWTGLHINATWPFLLVAMAVLLSRRRIRMSSLHWVGLLFLAYAAATVFWSPEPRWGLEKLLQLSILGLVFAYGSTLESLRPIFIGLGLGISVSAAIASAQTFGFNAILQTSIPGGLFGNSSILAQTAAIVLVALIVERIWWLTPGPILALFLGQSRSAMVAIGLVALIWSRWWLGIALIIIAAIIASDHIQFLREWGLHAAGKAPDLRLEIWGEILRTPSLLGHGLGSFAYSPGTGGIALHAHSDYLEFWSELGIGSLLLFAILILCFEADDNARTILLAFLVVALFAFPTWVPTSGFMAALVAGFLAGRRVVVPSLLPRNRPTMETV